MVLDLVLTGLAIALQPVPLTTFIIILGAERGTMKGAVFVFGWMASLAIVMAATILATDNHPPPPKSVPSAAALAFKIAVGVALFAIAERQRRRMGRPKRPKRPPRWQARVDHLSPLIVAGIAVFVQPWILIASAAATITEGKLSAAADYLTLVLFGLLATSTLLALEVHAAMWPEKSKARLAQLEGWIDHHKDLVIIVVAVALGCWFIGKSSYLLVS